MVTSIDCIVGQPLVIGPKGVVQYMTVSSGGRDYNMIPPPSALGLFAQIHAEHDHKVQISTVGDWGIYLTNGKQFGTPMSYANPDLFTFAEVIYVGAQSPAFRRAYINTGDTQKDMFATIVVPTGEQIRLKYSNLFLDEAGKTTVRPTKEEAVQAVNDFQGFVIASHGVYQTWFSLNLANLEAALQNANYRNIQSILPQKVFDLRRNAADRLSSITELIGESAKAAPVQVPAAPSKPAQSQLMIYGANLNQAYTLQIEPGKYSLMAIAGMIPQTIVGKDLFIVEQFRHHLDANLPVKMADSVVAKTATLVIEPGATYSFYCVEEVRPATAPSQPVIKLAPAAPRAAASPRQPEPKTEKITAATAPPAVLRQATPVQKIRDHAHGG